MRIEDHFLKAIRSAAVFNPEVQVAPACILWPDKERQWEAMIPRLQLQIPELCALGDYVPEKRQGPAIWLRCLIADTLDDVRIPNGVTPIIYLPGVGRQDLRAVESCPELLRPLAELQYRGVIWSQINAKDWTILAFLKSDQGGLGLDVAQDNDAKQAMQLALHRLLDEDVDLLRGKRLDRDYFNTLLTGGDPIRDLLQWLDQGDAFKQSRGETEWRAFIAVCKSQLGFNPETEGQLTGAAKLAAHDGPWSPVWERFCEAPRRYPNIPGLIRRTSLPSDLFADRTGWPQWNEKQEEELGTALGKSTTVPPHEARKNIRELERKHAARRQSVWAELGNAPLAKALAHLSRVAEICEQPLAVGGVSDMVAIFTTSGWEADDAVLRALAEVEAPQLAAVSAAINAIYKPWAEDAARRLQKLVDEGGYPGRKLAELKPTSPAHGELILFVDGLRYDLAQRLVALLETDGYEVERLPVWSALPSVTATAKPAVTPVAHQIIGSEVNADFEASVKETGQSLKGGYHLDRLLKEAGWRVLERNDVPAPTGSAWCEFGAIDHEGHDRGWMLSKQVDSLLEEIRKHVRALLDGGWTTVRIVTDHGFLLMPGGLPESHLPTSLCDNTWGRCAALKPGAQSAEAMHPWFWNPSLCFALADGISCYGKKREYTHGGISFQECYTLHLTVRSKRPAFSLQNVEITDATWKGLRLAVAVDGVFEGLHLDVRMHPGDPSSSIVMNPKPLKNNGTGSVVVSDDSLQSKDACIVLITGNGELVAQRPTLIGGKSA